MKKVTLLLTLGLFAFAAKSQTEPADTAAKKTIRIGNILIIKKDSKVNVTNEDDSTTKKKSRVTTNWGIIDLGFSNFSDKTNYGAPNSFLQNDPAGPPMNKHDFKTRYGKSINVNIWFFMQKVNLIKENVNLKYGLGLELNNYRFKSSVSLREGGILPYSGGLSTNQPFAFRDTIAFSKNKLAADYLTLPVMLNFSTNNKKGKTFGLSAGVSVGYLYSSRMKQKSDIRGNKKYKDDFDLEPFKLSYIGELTLGSVRLYGSYAPKSMFDNDMDFRPYTFGLRFSKF